MAFSAFFAAFAVKVLNRKERKVIAKDTKITFPKPSSPCLRWFLEFFTGCADALVAYSQVRMQDRTETLALGSRAPEFLLLAANRDGLLSLAGLLSRGTLIVEFLRGTW
jgi:hypothetical protein